MSEWFKEHAWKACIRRKPYRGFESRSLRQVVVPGLPGPSETPVFAGVFVFIHPVHPGPSPNFEGQYGGKVSVPHEHRAYILSASRL